MVIEIKNNGELQDHLFEITALNKVAIDTETTGLDPHTDKPLLFQLGNNEIQYVIHWYKVDIAPLKYYLESEAVTKLFLNHKFDYKMIKKQSGIEIVHNIKDLMLLELLNLGGRNGKVNMEALAHKYLGIVIDKTTRLSFIGATAVRSKKQIQYAADDIVITYNLHEYFDKNINSSIPKKVSNLEHRFSSCLGDIELHGMFLDRDIWMEIADEVVEKKRSVEKNLHRLLMPHCNTDLFGDPIINVDSNQQLLTALQRSGLRIRDTNAATMKKHFDNPIVRAILEYRKWYKSKTTYGENFLDYINPVTGRLHTSYWPMVSTGRLSSSEPNLQNIKAPKNKDDLNFRRAFTAQNPADRILTIDYAGCELRVLAQLSQDPVLLQTFGEERVTGEEADVHSKVAELLFKKEVSKSVNADLRKKTKNINFGLIYGMGAKKLAADLGIPLAEAKGLMKQYFLTMPSVSNYLDNAAKFATEHGYSETLSGRRRYYEMPDMHKILETYVPTQEELEEHGSFERAAKNKYTSIFSHIERCGKNTPIQGTNGDIVKLAIIYLIDDIKKNNRDIKIVNTVHDEVVFEGSNLEDYLPTAKALMEKAEAYFLPDVPPRVDCTIDNCWSK